MNIENEIEASVFISYAWGDKSEEFLQKLDNRLSELGGAKVVTDKDVLTYKSTLLEQRGWISDFMMKEGLGKYVVVLINDKYLKSETCMLELNEILRNPKFSYRIFPIFFADVNIFSPDGMLQYIYYWDTKVIEIEEYLRNYKGNENDSNLLYFKLNQLTNIRNNLAYNLQYLRDMNVLSIDKDKYENTIEILIRVINERLDEDRHKKRNK